MLDVVLGVILLVSVFGVARNGITKEAIRIAALILGTLASMWGYGVLAGILRPWIQNGRIASGVAFVLIFVGCIVAGALLARVLAGVWSMTGLRWIDRLLGAAFGVVRGLLITAVILLGLVAFQPFSGTSGAIANSRIAPWVLHLARTAAALAPQGLRDAFGQGMTLVERHSDADPQAVESDEPEDSGKT